MELFKLEAAVETFIWVFDQQKQKRKQAGERSADDGNQYRPQGNSALNDAR